jgi:hypothetical protein
MSPLMEAEERESRPSKRRPSANDGGDQEQPTPRNRGRDGVMEGLKGMFGF